MQFGLFVRHIRHILGILLRRIIRLNRIHAVRHLRLLMRLRRTYHFHLQRRNRRIINPNRYTRNFLRRQLRTFQSTPLVHFPTSSPIRPLRLSLSQVIRLPPLLRRMAFFMPAHGHNLRHFFYLLRVLSLLLRTILLIRPNMVPRRFLYIHLLTRLMYFLANGPRHVGHI